MVDNSSGVRGAQDPSDMGGLPASSGASRKYRADYVAEQFVQIYYNILRHRPVDLFRFYKDESLSYVADGPKEPVQVFHGEKQIREYPRHDFQGCRVECSALDSQWSATDAIVLLVYGRIYRHDDPQGRNFVHSFLLSPQTHGWYVRNDMFRYTDERRDRDPPVLTKDTANHCNGDVPVDSGPLAAAPPVEEPAFTAPAAPSGGPATEVLEPASGLHRVEGEAVSDDAAVEEALRIKSGGELLLGRLGEGTETQAAPIVQEEQAPAVVSTAVLADTLDVVESAPAEKAWMDRDMTQRGDAGKTPTASPADESSAPVDAMRKELRDESEPVSGPKFTYASIVSKMSGSAGVASVIPTASQNETTETVENTHEHAETTSDGQENGEISNAAAGLLPPGIYLSQLPNPRIITGMNLASLLQEEFIQYGSVQNMDVRANRGYAFVDYDSEESVHRAVAAWADGPTASAHEAIRKIRVQVRKPPPPRANRGTDGRNTSETKHNGTRNRPRQWRNRNDPPTNGTPDASSGPDSHKANRSSRRTEHSDNSANGRVANRGNGPGRPGSTRPTTTTLVTET